jgi:hypothetical protein
MMQTKFRDLLINQPKRNSALAFKTTLIMLLTSVQTEAFRTHLERHLLQLVGRRELLQPLQDRAINVPVAGDSLLRNPRMTWLPGDNNYLLIKAVGERSRQLPKIF